MLTGPVSSADKMRPELLHGYYSHCPSLPSPEDYRPNDEVGKNQEMPQDDDLIRGSSGLVRFTRRGAVFLQK